MSVNGPFGLRPVCTPKSSNADTCVTPREAPTETKPKGWEQRFRRRPPQQPQTERPLGWNLALGRKRT